MPSYTFSSTANAFVLRGAVPVFIDIRRYIIIIIIYNLFIVIFYYYYFFIIFLETHSIWTRNLLRPP